MAEETVMVGKGRKVTGTERDKLASDLKKAYASGVSIRTLAESTGRSYGFTRGILLEAGAVLRSPGGDARSQPGT
ncbi:helix-turn-helix domain-containing protein [Streptomyces sp. NBRC 110035]|uniref:helix-turn-helix domain-containing protein n=1 Tax=Streptomyces sp. NBRC 110035 TaxID=1547867 RepID=UPI0005A79F04|nr:helix-turn-helix domain-containing protein [Streptomyces sp. NBRC 110035]